MDNNLFAAVFMGGSRGGDSDALYYGVRFTTSQSDPDAESRIAEDDDLTLHASLPVHSLMKACVLEDDGTVAYYLDPDDWSKKESGAASNLDGTDGQVMIEVPEHYYREWEDGGYRNIAVCLGAKTGFTKVDKFYYGAYKAALNRTNNKLGSVKSTSSDWRGGNNNDAWDAADNSLLGKPATSISRTNFRTYARNRGSDWNILPYKQMMIIYRLFEIEYATRNSQKAVNGDLTVDGYRQGGLGVGVTTVAGGDWNTFSSYYPFVSNGASDSLASGSGEVDHVITGWPGGDETVKVNRYRGIEMPFGHLWEWVDGINIYNDHVAETFTAYMIDDPANFADDTTDNARAVELVKANGYVTELSLNDKLPTAVGGNSSTYYCDYHYSDYDAGSSYWRALLVGGSASYGGYAGFVCSYSRASASNAIANIGSRLCYLT